MQPSLIQKDVYHLALEGWRFYSHLGQKLTSVDIGHKFVRVYPHGSDWSYIPHRNEDAAILSNQMQLVSITAGKLFLKPYDPCLMNCKHELDPSWNDGYWAPVETYRALAGPRTAEKSIDEVATWTGKKFGELRGFRVIKDDIRILFGGEFHYQF